ncbi:DUF456 domain-containing protein [Bacillus suaedae]|uniref:DUF456 domain-containing protein n=1 Tax=Halalkalibacter suaedae TaxID=2822140 RepID=A0A940WXY2_9BACI|nr:DUF456 domain-containing protein [Bacillus suaedae]MBP3952757.1 DUF456 domain-containing protein [Bacillus suaedae]
MDVILWVLICILFVLSFVGLIFPIIPSILVLWGGFLLYLFGIGGTLSPWFFIGAGLFTVLILIADLLVNQFFVKKYGGSKWSERVAAVAVIVGSFVYPPFGLLIIPFLAVFITEVIVTKNTKHASLVAVGSVFAFLSSTFAKGFIQLLLIGWFFIEVFF